MKNILLFPINIFVYAGKGVKYTFSFLFKSKKKNVSNKLEGEVLEKELQKVREESDEFKRKAVSTENNVRVEKPKKLTQFKYLVKCGNNLYIEEYREDGTNHNLLQERAADLLRWLQSVGLYERYAKNWEVKK